MVDVYRESRRANGTYGPIRVTNGIPAGQQTPSNFIPTPELRPVASEQLLCDRYFESLSYPANSYVTMAQAWATTAAQAQTIPWRTVMRASPSVTLPPTGSGAGGIYFANASGGPPSTLGTITAFFVNQIGVGIGVSGATGAFTAGNASALSAGSSGTATITASAEI